MKGDGISAGALFDAGLEGGDAWATGVSVTRPKFPFILYWANLVRPTVFLFVVFSEDSRSSSTPSTRRSVSAPFVACLEICGYIEVLGWRPVDVVFWRSVVGCPYRLAVCSQGQDNSHV